MPRLDGCTETVAIDDLPAQALVDVLGALLDRLGLVITRSDWGRGERFDLVTKDEATARADAYEQEYR